MASTFLSFDIFARDRASGAFNKVGRSADTAHGSVARFGTAFSKSGLAIGAAVTGLGVASAGILKVGIAYQDSLNTLQAVTQASAAQMDAAAKKAQALGANLSLPATSGADAAQAMTELAKGGLSVNQAMKAALGTLQLSAAAQVDGATAAQIQVAALNQFSLSAASAGKVADVLANTANAASGEITDMANALSYVGPVAHAFGVNITDTATALGLLAKGGIIAEKAGTGLRGILASLANPSQKQAAGFKTLGVTAFDASGKFVGLRKVIEELAAAHKHLSEEQFNQAATAAVGRYQLAAANTLASQGAKEFDKMRVAVDRQGGAAAVAAAKMKGLHGAWEGLKSQLETVAITIFTAVAPALTGLLHWVAMAIPKVQSFFSSLRDGSSAGSGFVSWITGKLVPAIKAGFADLLPKVEGAVKSIRATIQSNRGTFTALGQMFAIAGNILTTVLIPAFFKLQGVYVSAIAPAFKTLVFLLKNLVIPAFVLLARAWLTTIDILVSGAAKAFGWVPGIGGKLKAANASFDAFASGVNASLDSIQRDVNVNVTVHYNTVASDISGGIDGTSLTPQQAAAQNRANMAHAAAQASSRASTQAKASARTVGSDIGNSLAAGLGSTAGAVGAGAKKATDAATKQLTAFQQAVVGMRDSVRESVMGFFTLQTEGNPFAGLSAMANKAVKFAHALARLVKQGVNPAVIAMIAQAGPDVGLRAAVELSTAGKANRNRINSAFTTISNAANSAANTVANAQTSDSLGVQKSQLTELREIRKAVTRHHKSNALNSGWSAA